MTTHNMTDADLLCDRVAFISNGNLAALDTPKRLKEKNSNQHVVIDYLYQGQRQTKTIEALQLASGIPFAHDELISIHSQEPTLEDMFIQYTGRGCHDVEKLLRPAQKRLSDAGIRQIFSHGNRFFDPLYGLCKLGIYPVYENACL